jgi:hypothetical protein
MKKLISSILLVTMIPWQAFADCDWKTGIKPITERSSYEYTLGCHIKVGETVRDLGIAQEQVKLLSKSLELKDLAIKTADQRADMWMKTSEDLNSKIDTLQDMDRQNKWIYFGLGFLAASVSVYAVSQIRH